MSTHQLLQDTQPVPELGELPGDGASPSLPALCSLPDSDVDVWGCVDSAPEAAGS